MSGRFCTMISLMALVFLLRLSLKILNVDGAHFLPIRSVVSYLLKSSLDTSRKSTRLRGVNVMLFFQRFPSISA